MLMEHHKSTDTRSQATHISLTEEPSPGAPANKSSSPYLLPKLNTSQQRMPQKKAFGFATSSEKSLHLSYNQLPYIATIDQPLLSLQTAIFMLEPNISTYDITSSATLSRTDLSLLSTVLQKS